MKKVADKTLSDPVSDMSSFNTVSPQQMRLLLDINRTVALARDRNQLFQAVMATVKQLVDYDLAPTIFVVDQDESQYQIFWTQNSPGVADNELAIWQNQPVPLADDPIISSLMIQQEVCILTTREANRRWKDYPARSVTQLLGIQEALHAPLRVQGKPLGILTVCSQRENHFQPSQLILFQAIADQVAVAVSNILAGEILAGRAYQSADGWRTLGRTSAASGPKTGRTAPLRSPAHQYGLRVYRLHAGERVVYSGADRYG
jgi:GAF domain-containing protein